VPAPRWPGVVTIAIGTNPDEALNQQLLTEFQERLQRMSEGYRHRYPHTRIQLNLYRQEALLAAMRRRRQAGLEPDLMILDGDVARRMLSEGLVSPFPAAASELALFDPLQVARSRAPDGQLAGLPLLMQTQISCFRRDRLPQPPSTTTELLQAGGRGVVVALPIELENLFWSAGSLGALPALEAALRGGTPTDVQRRGLRDWLQWLQIASRQPKVLFYSEQQAAEDAFLAGRIDWLPCRSTVLPRLRRLMGPRLGVAELPAGEAGGQASPINRMRLWVLGRTTAGEARRRALGWVDYTLNPLMQRSLTVGVLMALPANRSVNIPIGGSEELQAMLAARKQGDAISRLWPLIRSDDPRLPALEAQIVDLVFGEAKPEDTAEALLRILRGPAPERTP